MNSLPERLEEQYSILQQALNINRVLFDNLNTEQEAEKSAYTKLKLDYQQLQARISELEGKKCEMCEILKQKLVEERKSTKSANSRLKLIASLIYSDDGGNTNTLTNVKLSKLTQLLEDSPEKAQSKKRKFNSLIADKDDKILTSRKLNSTIIVPETMPIQESQVELQDDKYLVIPETQMNAECVQDSKKEKFVSSLISDLVPQNNTFLEKVEEKVEKLRAQRQSHTSKEQLAWSKSDEFKNKEPSTSKSNENDIVDKLPSRILNKHYDGLKAEKVSSPSVINREVLEGSTIQAASSVNDVLLNQSNKSPKSTNIRKSNTKKNEDLIQDSYWKLKPSLLLKSDTKKGDKVLKQTTLSLGAVKKKQDITMLKNFNGGTTNSNQEEIDSDDCDVVLESPKHKENTMKKCGRKPAKTLNLEKTLIMVADSEDTESGTNTNKNRAETTLKLDTNDLDETLFQPAVTSTCLPTILPDNSFDRLPDRPKSPNFKYKRETVRKKQDRLRLPGWSCDDCEQYYQVAGQSWSREEIQKRMNACSRHRDKYMLRPKTPPGFWNPVIPPS